MFREKVFQAARKAASDVYDWLPVTIDGSLHGLKHPVSRLFGKESRKVRVFLSKAAPAQRCERLAPITSASATIACQDRDRRGRA